MEVFRGLYLFITAIQPLRLCVVCKLSLSHGHVESVVVVATCLMTALTDLVDLFTFAMKPSLSICRKRNSNLLRPDAYQITR
jgi:hypothetical protein